MLDNRSVSYFLSEYWRNTPLYAEKLIPLLDTCLSSNFVLSDKVANAFYELANKYQHTDELPVENLKEFIREQGYGYILDLVVQVDAESVKLLWYMLVLIHQLKGSKEGILLVLSLFDENFDPTKTTITEWHEMTPVGRPHTFALETAVDISRLGEGFFKKFEKFLANYVYPEMLALKINYSVDGRITYRPYARVKINSRTNIDLRDGYNAGGADQKLLGDVYNAGGANETYATPTYLIDTEEVIDPNTQEHYATGTSVDYKEIVYQYDVNEGEYVDTETYQYIIMNGGGAFGTTWLINGDVKGWTASRSVIEGLNVLDYDTLPTSPSYYEMDKLGEVEVAAPNYSKFMYRDDQDALHECVFNE